MVNRREQAALLLALRDSERGWADVTNVALESPDHLLRVLDELRTEIPDLIDL